MDQRHRFVLVQIFLAALIGAVGSQVTTSGDTPGPPNNQSHTTPGKDAVEYARYTSDSNKAPKSDLKVFSDFGSQTNSYADGEAQTIRFSSNLSEATHFTPDSGSPKGAEEQQSVRPVFGFPSQQAPQTDPPKALQQQFSSYNQQGDQQVVPQGALLNRSGQGVGSMKSADSQQLSDSNLSPPSGGKSMQYSTISNLIPTEQASLLVKAPSEHESITQMSDSTVSNVNVRDSQLGSVVRPDYSQNHPSSDSSPLELQHPNTQDSSTPTYLSSISSSQPVTSDQHILIQNKSTEDPYQQNLNMTDTTETVSKHYPIIFSGGEQRNSNSSAFGSTTRPVDTSNSTSPNSLDIKNSSRPVGIDSASSTDKEQLSHELLGIPLEQPTNSSTGNNPRIGTVLPKIGKGGRMLELPPDPISDVTLPPTDAFGAIRDPTQPSYPSPDTASFELTGNAKHIFSNILTQYAHLPYHDLGKGPIKYSSRQNVFPGAQSTPPVKMNQPHSYFSISPDSSVQFPSLQFHGESVSPGSIQFDGTVGLWSSSMPILFEGKTSHMSSTGGKQPSDPTLSNGSPNFPGFFVGSSFIPFSKTEKPGHETVPFSYIPSGEERLQNVPITTASGQSERIIPQSTSTDLNNNMTEKDRLLLFPVSIRFDIPPGLRFSGRMKYPAYDSGLTQPLSSYLNSISASGQQRSQQNPRLEAILAAMFSTYGPKQARRTISKPFDGIERLDVMNYFSPNNPKESVTLDPYESIKTGLTGVHNVPGRPIMGLPSMMDGIHPVVDLLSVKNGNPNSKLGQISYSGSPFGSDVAGIGYGGRTNGNPNNPYYEYSNTEYPNPFYPSMSESLDIVRQYHPNWFESRQVARKPGTESQPFDAPGMPVISKDSNPGYGYPNNRYIGYDFLRNPSVSTTFESSPLLHREMPESHRVPEKPVMAAWMPEVGNYIHPNYGSQIYKNPVPGNVNYPNPSEINSNYKSLYPGNPSYSGTLDGIPLPDRTMPGSRNNLKTPITPTEISGINNYVRVTSFSPNNELSNDAPRYGYAPLPALPKDTGRSITANRTPDIQNDVISDNRNPNNAFANYDELKYRFPSLPNVRFSVENTTSSSTPDNPNVSNQEYENSLSNGIRNLRNPPIPGTINGFSRVEPSIPRSPHITNDGPRNDEISTYGGQEDLSVSRRASSDLMPGPRNTPEWPITATGVPDVPLENNPNYDNQIYLKPNVGNHNTDAIPVTANNVLVTESNKPGYRKIPERLSAATGELNIPGGENPHITNENNEKFGNLSYRYPDSENPNNNNPRYDYPDNPSIAGSINRNRMQETTQPGYREIPGRPSIATAGLTPKVNNSNYAGRTNQNPYTGYLNNENPRHGNPANPSISGTGNLLVQESAPDANQIDGKPNTGNPTFSSPLKIPHGPTTALRVPGMPNENDPNYVNHMDWEPNAGNSTYGYPDQPVSETINNIKLKTATAGPDAPNNVNLMYRNPNSGNPMHGYPGNPSIARTVNGDLVPETNKLGNLETPDMPMALTAGPDIPNKNNFKYSNLIYRNPDSGNYQNIKYGSPEYSSISGSVSDNVRRQETALPLPWKIAGRPSPYSKVIDSLDGNPDTATPYDDNVQGYPFSPGTSSSVLLEESIIPGSLRPLPNFGALHAFPQGDATVSGSREIPKSPLAASYSPDVSLSDINPKFVNPNYGSDSPITVVLTKPSAANRDEALNIDGTNYDNEQYRYNDGSPRKLPIINGPGTNPLPHSILFESMDLPIRPKTEPQHNSGLGKLDVSTRDSPSHTQVSRSLDTDPRSPLVLKTPTPASKDFPKIPNIGSPTKLFNYFKTLRDENPNYEDADNEYPGKNQQVGTPDGSSLQNSSPLKPKDPTQKGLQNPPYSTNERQTNLNLEPSNQNGPSLTLEGVYYPNAGLSSQPSQLADRPNVTSTDSASHNPLQPFLGNSEPSTTRHPPFIGDSEEIHGRDIVGHKPDSTVDFSKPTDQPGQYVPARSRGTATITVIPHNSKNALHSESYQYQRVGLDVNTSHPASNPMKNEIGPSIRYYPANAQTDQPEPQNSREIIGSLGADAKYNGAGEHYGASNPIEYDSANRQSGLASEQPSALNPRFENIGYTINIQPDESDTAPDSTRTPIVEGSSTPGSIKYIPGYQEGQATSEILSPEQDNTDPTNKPYSYRSPIYQIPVNNEVTKSDSKQKDDVSSPDGGDTYPQTRQPGDARETSQYYSGNIHNQQTSGEQLPSDPRYGGHGFIMRKLQRPSDVPTISGASIIQSSNPRSAQYHPEIIQLNQSAGDNLVPTNGQKPSGALHLSKQLASPNLNQPSNEIIASETPEFSSKEQIEIDSPGGGAAMYYETMPGSVRYHSATKSDPTPIGVSITDQDNVDTADGSPLAGSYLRKSYILSEDPAKSTNSTDQSLETNSKESIDVNLLDSATKLTQTREGVKGSIKYYQSDKPDQDREGRIASSGIQSYIINTQPAASDTLGTQQISGSTVIQNPQMRTISQGYASNVVVDGGQVHQNQAIPEAAKYVSGLRLYRQKTEPEDASGLLSSTVPKMSDISYKVVPNSPVISASGLTAGKAVSYDSITHSSNAANYPKIIPPSVGLTNAAQSQVSGSRYIISRPASSMTAQYLSPPISSAAGGASMVHHQFINQPITSQIRYSLIPTGYRRIAQNGPAVSNSQSSGDLMKSIIPLIASLPKGMKAGVTRGKYSYTGPDGKMITKDWYVDETGFHIEGDGNAKKPT